MIITKRQLSRIVNYFLTEVEEPEKKKTPTLNPITIIQDDIKVELKKEGEKIKVYVKGNELPSVENDKISAIIAKAHKEIAQSIADGEIDAGEASSAAENILNWADALMSKGRAGLQSVEKNRLSVLWNSWMEALKG